MLRRGEESAWLEVSIDLESCGAIIYHNSLPEQEYFFLSFMNFPILNHRRWQSTHRLEGFPGIFAYQC
jgi:hypothetical protein